MVVLGGVLFECSFAILTPPHHLLRNLLNRRWGQRKVEPYLTRVQKVTTVLQGLSESNPLYVMVLATIVPQRR